MSFKVEFKRILKIHLPEGQSAFLWGPRKTGKTSLLRQQFSKSTTYDFLEGDLYDRFSREPSRFREEVIDLLDRKILRQPVIIDEVQKIPRVLDEVHWLLEKKKVAFLMCGSSARKLRRPHANMLGGRAWRFELFPLTSRELGRDFSLLKALNQGLIPSHYLSRQPERSLKAYVQDYLKEEIQQEGLVRNLPAFSRFLDSVSFSMGEMVNYANIARDCGVDAKTVMSYYQILVDTLVGYFLEPYRKQRNRQIITATPKFYLFDVGVAGCLKRRQILIDKGEEFGRAFEHFIFMEILAYRAYSEKDVPITYWRTKDGAEVDFVIGDGLIAIEVKGSKNVAKSDLTGLNAFIREYHPRKTLLVSQEPASRKLDQGIEILPWRNFLNLLWDGEIF